MTRPYKRRRAQAGRNNPRQERLNALLVGSVALVLLMLSGGAAWLLRSTTMPPRIAGMGGPWTLMRGDGQVLTDHDLRGRYLLIYFGYTSCPDVCPMTLTAVADATRQLGRRADRLQPIFITVDPAHDTPQVVQRFVRNFGPQIIGLTGTAAQIHAVEQEYRVTIITHPALSGQIRYTIDHTSVLLLMGQDGQFLAPLPATATGPELANQLASYLP